MYKNMFSLIFPEIFLISLTCFILLFSFFVKNKKSLFYIVQLSLFFLCLYFIFILVYKKDIILDDSYFVNYFTLFFKFIVILFSFFIFSYSKRYLFFLDLYLVEYYCLFLFSILGMMILISSNNFLILYLGLELLALPLYVLISISKKHENNLEAAIKYFVMGSVASGLLLFGISLIYGLTNSIYFTDIFDIIFRDNLYNNIIMQLSIVFILIGFSFKFGIVPFHMWVPDVYHGAPISVTLLISTIPKLAYFCIFYRLFVEVFELFVFEWSQILIYLGLLSLFLGNITAISQINIKRMLAYSSISHVGFIFFALATGSKYGHVSAFFYLFTYILMVMGAFGVIIILSKYGSDIDQIDSLSGLGYKYPFLSIIMSTLMFSMGGIPPFVGFYAKLLVLKDLIYLDYYFVVFFAILLSVIGLFYYLRIVKVMFFESKSVIVFASDKEEQNHPLDSIILLFINGFLVLFFGLYPDPLINICIKLVN